MRRGCRAGRQAVAWKAGQGWVRQAATVQAARRRSGNYAHHCTPAATSGIPGGHPGRIGGRFRCYLASSSLGLQPLQRTRCGGQVGPALACLHRQPEAASIRQPPPGARTSRAVRCSREANEADGSGPAQRVCMSLSTPACHVRRGIGVEGSRLNDPGGADRLRPWSGSWSSATTPNGSGPPTAASCRRANNASSPATPIDVQSAPAIGLGSLRLADLLTWTGGASEPPCRATTLAAVAVRSPARPEAYAIPRKPAVIPPSQTERPESAS